VKTGAGLWEWIIHSGSQIQGGDGFSSEIGDSPSMRPLLSFLQRKQA
jgi:hypothetical protein